MGARRRRGLGLALTLACCLSLALAGCGGRVQAEYRVVVATDLHYLAPSLTDHGPIFQRMMENSDGKCTPYCDEILDAFLLEVIELRPEALILTGDLSFNGERESHLALAEKLKAVEEAGIPVLVLPGNHDLYRSQTYAYFGDSAEWVPNISAEDFREIYSAYGFDEAIASDPDSLSYAARLNSGTRVLMLDANTLHDFCGLSEKSLAWVEEQLAEARREGEAVLVCCHQNLFRHSLFDRGYVLNRSQRLAALLEQYEVPLMLSGHMHIQHVQTESKVTEIATSSLTMGACRYGILEASEGVLRYEAHSVEVSAWAKKQGLTDEALLNFGATAAESMARRTRAQAEEQLAERDVSPEERAALIEYACALNEAYFSGDLTGIPALDPEGKLLQGWLESGTMFGSYFSSIQGEIGRDHTRWQGSARP